MRADLDEEASGKGQVTKHRPVSSLPTGFRHLQDYADDDVEVDMDFFKELKLDNAIPA